MTIFIYGWTIPLIFVMLHLINDANSAQIMILDNYSCWMTYIMVHMFTDPTDFHIITSLP